MVLFADKPLSFNDFAIFVNSVFSSSLQFLLNHYLLGASLGAFIAGCIILGVVLRRFMYH